ncbi:MAG: TRL-like family protein [Alphaproteobacteria bacterium]|nr:TRL-like family protein [Alphaproteobacteria bacterium]
MKTILALSAVALLSACGMPSKTGPALFQKVSESELATTNTGSREGRACSSNILGIVSLGDSSIEAAKKNGHITRVASVDADITAFLGGIVYGERCTVVTGQ